MKNEWTPYELRPSLSSVAILLGLPFLLIPSSAVAGFYFGGQSVWIDRKNSPTFSIPDATVSSAYSDSSRGYGLSLGYQKMPSHWAIESGALLFSSPLTISAQDGPVTAEGTAIVQTLQIPVLLRWTRLSYLTVAAGAFANLPLSIEESGDIEGLSLEYDWGVSAALRFQAPLFKGRLTVSTEFRINQGIKTFDGSRNRDQLILIGLTLGESKK